MKNTHHTTAAFEHIVIWIMAPLVMAACSGGSTSGGISGSISVRALSLPDRIELTPMEGRSAFGREASPAGLFQASCDEAGADCGPAARHTWVDDNDVLDMVNGILGIVKDNGYAGFVNQGPNLAMVRQVGENRQSPSGDPATAATAEQRMAIYLEVIRASNSSPMIVKVRMKKKQGSGQGQMLIRGCFTVTRGVSAAYPYGVMFALFKGTALDSEGNEGADTFAMGMSVGASGGNVVIEDVGGSTADDAYGSHGRVRMAANVDVTGEKPYFKKAETGVNPAGLLNRGTVQAAFNTDDFKATEECRTPVYYAME